MRRQELAVTARNVPMVPVFCQYGFFPTSSSGKVSLSLSSRFSRWDMGEVCDEQIAAGCPMDLVCIRKGLKTSNQDVLEVRIIDITLTVCRVYLRQGGLPIF